jgi:hypothetical protein
LTPIGPTLRQKSGVFAANYPQKQRETSVISHLPAQTTENVRTRKYLSLGTTLHAADSGLRRSDSRRTLPVMALVSNASMPGPPLPLMLSLARNNSSTNWTIRKLKMEVTFDFSALHYLDQWVSSDKQFHNGLNSTSRDERLASLNRMASGYGVARNLHKEHDVGGRLELVLDIIEKPEYQHITLDNRVEIIESVTDEIEKHYHARVLSFVTKALWTKHRTPIVIYDSKAREALKKYGYLSGHNDISQYLTSWEEFCRSRQAEISNACQSLYTQL